MLFEDNFFMASNNALFIPGVVYPTPFELEYQYIQLTTTRSFNLTSPIMAPAGVDQASINDAVFEQMLGTYTCSVESPYGSDNATTVIRECGKYRNMQKGRIIQCAVLHLNIKE